MAYVNFKDLTRRTASAKILHNKAFSMLKILHMMDINVDFLQWFMKLLIKVLQVVPLHLQKKSGVKKENFSNKELAEELHKPIIRKFRKRTAHSSFIGNIWSANLAYMQLISKFNKGIHFFIMCY